MSHVGALLARLVRSAGAGAVATVVDLGSLTALVSIAGLSPRAASVPALVLGGIVMFFGQKHWAFRSHAGRTGREAVLFALVQIGGLVLTALLFEFVMRVAPAATRYYVIVRLVTTNVVWVGYSFPLWHLVFKPGAEPERSSVQ
jgi:putative flippase GtrA